MLAVICDDEKALQLAKRKTTCESIMSNVKRLVDLCEGLVGVLCRPMLPEGFVVKDAKLVGFHNGDALHYDVKQIEPIFL